MYIRAPSFVRDIQAIKHLPHTGLGMASQPGAVLQQILEPPTRAVDPDLMRITAHHMQQGFFGDFAILVGRGKKQACVHVLSQLASLPIRAFGSD